MDDLQNPLSNNNPTDDQATPDPAATPLPEDNDTPAVPATDQPITMPPDQPQTDSNVDAHQAYDENQANATAPDSSTGSAATGSDEQPPQNNDAL